MNSSASARGTMSDAGSSRMRRISSPTIVPPGSRTATHGAAALRQPVGEPAKLRGLARALRPLEDDQAGRAAIAASRA